MNTEIALALIAILATVVNGVVSRLKGKREQSEEVQDKYIEHLTTQSSELLSIIKARGEVQDRQMGEVLKAVQSLTDKVNALESRLETHIRQETAINESLIISMKKEEHNGDLATAEALVNMEKRAYKFDMIGGK